MRRSVVRAGATKPVLLVIGRNLTIRYTRVLEQRGVDSFFFSFRTHHDQWDHYILRWTYTYIEYIIVLRVAKLVDDQRAGSSAAMRFGKRVTR